MIEILKKYSCPYVMMHSRGLPQNMLEKRFLDYGDDFIKVMVKEIDEKIVLLRQNKILE